MNLKTVVGRARAGRHRVRSALTQWVNVIEAMTWSVHTAFLKIASGQLPDLGSWHRPPGTAELLLGICQLCKRPRAEQELGDPSEYRTPLTLSGCLTTHCTTDHTLNQGAAPSVPFVLFWPVPGGLSGVLTEGSDSVGFWVRLNHALHLSFNEQLCEEDPIMRASLEHFRC